VQIDIDIFGEKQVARNLRGLARAADNMRPAYDEIADDFLRIEREQFATQGARGPGGAWVPLKPSTLRNKARKGQPSTILVATDALRKSLTQRGARGSVRTIRKDTVTLGTRISEGFVSTRASGRGTAVGFNYPQALQHGTRKMPARRVVDITEEDRRRWVKIMQRRIMESIRRG
jgi:phage gpG-like protein